MRDQDAQSIAHVPVDGGALAVLRKGRGPKTVWLHGWALDHRMWRPQLALAAQWTMIAPDRRGFGQSSAPGDLDREWQDIDALVPAAEPFALIGFSQGAAVALDYARKHPGRVSALILIGTPLHGLSGLEPEPDALQRAELADMAQSGRLAEIKTMWRGHPFMRMAMTARPLRDRMVDAYEGRDLLSGQRTLRFSRQDLAALPMPVLALAGEDDTPWRRRCAELIAEGAPKGELAIVAGAGHACTLDDPAQANEIISQFLQSWHGPADGTARG